MRIAIVNRHTDDVLGGSEIQCDNIAIGLQAKGHQVFYIAPAGKPGHDYKRSYAVVPVESNASAISNAVLAQNPDIVYWRFNKYYFYNSAKRFAAKNIPIIFAISHIRDVQPWSYIESSKKGIVPFLKVIKQSILSRWNHRGYRYINGITCLNLDFVDLLPVKNYRLTVDSVDTAVVPFSWPRPFIVWVANIKPQKRPELFVELAKEFADQGIDFLLIGYIQSEAYEWIKTEHERTPNFKYLGPKTVQEVNGILEQSLFLVHTCKPEGFGNNFIQAWFQRKPTITYEFDPASYIEDNQLGGCAHNDWGRFVELTRGLIADPALRKAAGERGYIFADQNFTIDKTVQEIEDFMKEQVKKTA